MAKVATTTKALLGKVKDKGEYKNSARDKGILKERVS